MATKVRRIDYAPDEYVSGVGGVLRADEQGIYWMICSLVMSQGGPITRDERRIGSLCLMRPADVRRIIDRLICIGKIEVDGDKLFQKRALSEIERSANRIQIASENGAKGGRPTAKEKQKQENTKADGYSAEKLSLTSNDQQVLDVGSNEPTHIRPKPARKRHEYGVKFQEFWSSYPTDPLMSKKAASEAFEKLDVEQQIEVIASLPAFRAHCSSHVDYRPVHAVRYITQGRFEGFLASSRKINARVFVTLDSPAWKAMLGKRGVTSMAHSEHEGKRGWWFDQAEVAAATEPTDHAA